MILAYRGKASILGLIDVTWHKLFGEWAYLEQAEFPQASGERVAHLRIVELRHIEAVSNVIARRKQGIKSRVLLR
jgi:hypothetical protein